MINEVRQYVGARRSLPAPNQWQVTPETTRLLQHWRQHSFSSVRPLYADDDQNLKILNNVRQQLKPGGRVLLSVMNSAITERRATRQLCWTVVIGLSTSRE